ncbi:metallophosphoesterase family protein [Candidatus Woesearchaeota archaeon]|nr:metallophosphoesterase family protein [Candidatus Woesearchaeota archaeon]
MTVETEPQVQEEVAVLDSLKLPAAVISDVHGNLEAFLAVLGDIDKRGIETILNCGDLVGYGPNPCECIELARERVRLSVKGNNDVDAIDLNRIMGNTNLQEHARASLTWTSYQLSPDDKQYLSGMLLTECVGDVVISHASAVPEDRQKFLYMDVPPRGVDYAKYVKLMKKRNLEYLRSIDKRALLFGHSHIPGFFADVEALMTQQMKYDKNGKVVETTFPLTSDGCLVNVGSVGQPRDHDPRASYGIYTGKSVTIVRVEYDFHETQQKILKAGLPEIHATRLESGR